jgi:hypothetical protein
MADQVTVDASELDRFVADLGRIPGRVVPAVDAIVKRGAGNVKDELVADAEGSQSFRRMAPSISYDSHYRVGQVAYEIGPDRARGRAGGAAHLANIAYFGGANGGGGTLDLDAPLKHEEPKMMKALDDFLMGLL